MPALDIVFLGLSVTSSWGNGHATTYRALLRALVARGHRVLFLERDVPWYAQARDLPSSPDFEIALYQGLDDLSDRYGERVRGADVVVVGSYVPEGRAVADWVLATARGCRAFYDIDTPVTLSEVSEDRCAYLARAQVPRFDLYLSFTGGPTIARLEGELGAQRARPLYCSFDPAICAPVQERARWDLGYMGTYSADRQGALAELMLATAARQPTRRFTVAGSLYPPTIVWPSNVERIEHLAPAEHRGFYASQLWTLNLTRADMRVAGYSPSVRLFEAAACAVPVLTDDWPGLEQFFVPGREIVVVRSTGDVARALNELSPDEARRVGENARRRVVAEHSADCRAESFERDVQQAIPRVATGVARPHADRGKSVRGPRRTQAA